MSQALLPHKDGPWTIEDLAMLPEDERRYEIVDGQLVMVPSPSLGHQSVVESVRELIRPCLGDTMLSFEGVALDLHPSYRIPDLTVFSTDGFDPKAIKLHPGHVLLVVEVVSPGSLTNDRITKPAQYAAAGIPAYWRIETEGRLSLTAYALRGETYEEIGTWAEGEIAEFTEPFALSIAVADLTPPGSAG